MVFATSDSCNTLVTLDGGIKQETTNHVQAVEQQETFVRTEILLLNDDDEYCDCDECDYEATFPSVQQNLYLPTSSSTAVDMYLRTVPEIMESADVLLANEPRCFTTESKDRVLYVGQGEVAHAVPSQCDVIVSDKATTCHILALRSTYKDNTTTTTPLVSLTHIDSACYQDCIRGMVNQHKVHHMSSRNVSLQEEKKEEDDYSMNADDRIEMDIHIMGGFEDADGTSRELSTFLLHTLASLAQEEQSVVRMSLRTCAVSSMNDTGHACPIGRGLGIDLHAGEAFLAKVDRTVAGPRPELRSARIWAGLGYKNNHKLSVIHTNDEDDQLLIRPFRYEAFKEIEVLVGLPDHVLLQYTSTSPDVEEDDFCSNLRSTLKYMRSNKCCDVFGKHCDAPIVYSRVGATNSWKLVSDA